MEQNTQNKENKFFILEDQIRDCFGRVVYTHKTQEKCADILLKRQNLFKNCQIILSALATGSIITLFFGTGEVGTIISGVISTFLLVINSYAKSKDFGMEAQKHRQSAANIWLIREKYLSLLANIRMKSETLDDLSKRRDDILEELHDVYLGSPSTNFRAYLLAKKALQQNEEMTFKDQEIDIFLPESLRRS